MSVLAYMGYYYYDVTYLLVILGAVLSMIASAQVNSTFKRYSRVQKQLRHDRSRGCGADFIPERSDECAD